MQTKTQIIRAKMQSLEALLKQSGARPKKQLYPKKLRSRSSTPHISYELQTPNVPKVTTPEKEKEILKSIESYTTELKNLDKDFECQKGVHLVEKNALTFEIYQKQYHYQTKHNYFLGQKELIENVAQEQERIQSTIRMYQQRFEQNQRDQSKLQDRLRAMNEDLQKIENDLHGMTAEALQITQKFHDYTESHLKIKTHMLHFIRELEKKKAHLKEGKSNTDSFKEFSELTDLNNMIEDIKCCKICYKSMTSVFICSNSHLLCENCIMKIKKCPWCSNKVPDFKKNRIMEEIIAKSTPQK